jgi:hypothetical protein
MKFKGSSGLSAEQFATILADPEKYQHELAGFSERKTEAERAEAQAAERKTEAERAEAKSKGSLEALAGRATALDELQATLDEQSVALNKREADADARDASFTARAETLDEREAALAGERADAVAAVRVLLGE